MAEGNELEGESSSDEVTELVTPQTARAQHPISSPILSTPSNPSRHLPDRALSMQLHSRK